MWRTKTVTTLVITLGIMGRGRNNLDHPDTVLDVHRAYREAGSGAIITNTLTMNRIYLESHNVEVGVEETGGMPMALHGHVFNQY